MKKLRNILYIGFIVLLGCSKPEPQQAPQYDAVWRGVVDTINVEHRYVQWGVLADMARDSASYYHKLAIAAAEDGDLTSFYIHTNMYTYFAKLNIDYRHMSFIEKYRLVYDRL
jgi:hypothetical protein